MSCPLHNAQPLGAKLNEKSRISLKNGSAMFDPPCLIDTSYALPHVWFSQRYFSFLLFFVFSLAERKNEKQFGKYQSDHRRQSRTETSDHVSRVIDDHQIRLLNA